MAHAEVFPEQQKPQRDLSKLLYWYQRAKDEEWQVKDLPWAELSPVPEPRPSASPRRKALQNDVWRSVITQQWQADELACLISSQLLNAAGDHEAKLYYSTMMQDESRHTEAWLRLLGATGGPVERNPHLDDLVSRALAAETVEEQVFMMQVFYERAIISRFRLIAKSAGNTVVRNLCERLIIDDGIHHGAGLAYEKVLLKDASPKIIRQVEQTATAALPIFIAHAHWRPEARREVARAMELSDDTWVREEVEHGLRLAKVLGLKLPDADTLLEKAA